jgi:hippurate hydrolase
MLQQRPGTYLMIGNGESASLHNPRYNFNDAILTTGAAYWTGLVERYLRP